MTTHTLARLGPACGILFGALLLAGDTVGVLPVARLGLALLVPFVAYLATLIGGWLGATVLGAGLVGTALKLVSVVPEVTVDAQEEGSTLATALDDLSVTATVVAMYPLAILTAAVAVSTFATRVLPQWSGWLATVATIALLANSLFLESQNVPALLLFILWTLATSVRLLIRPTVTDSVAPAAA